MDTNTYEALKRLVDYCRAFHASNVDDDIKQVEIWIDEVSKEYESNDTNN